MPTSASRIQISDFTQDPTVIGYIAELVDAGIPEKRFSDVVDDQGRQYVDLVQEGGGTLGIALPGYTYVLEQMGIRFYSLAGTSAGAINTMMMAAVAPMRESKSEIIIRLMTQLYDGMSPDFEDFVDGPSYVQKTIRRALADEPLLSWRNPLTWPRIRGLYRTLKWARAQFGLNPGGTFHAWVRSVLNDYDASTTKDLMARFQDVGSVRVREDRTDVTEPLRPPRLALVATEITTESRILFPEMTRLFTNDEDAVHPAEFVRASMSVPGFFEPYRWRIDPSIPENELRHRWKDWDRGPRFYGDLTNREAVFVDGGVVSNFPIDVFHDRTAVPTRPTFGVKLGTDRTDAKSIDSLSSMAWQSFNTARHILDYQFLLRNEDYENLITRIETGDVHWLNFELSKDDMLHLFRAGAKAARDFLLGTKPPPTGGDGAPPVKDKPKLPFDWEHYKAIRKGQLATPPVNPSPRPPQPDADA